MKKLALICIVFMALKANAQLPSEKSTDELNSPAAKPKLQSTKPRNFSPTELPGNAPLPKMAIGANRKLSSLSKIGKQKTQGKLPSELDDDDLQVRVPKPKRNN
jgi:hypothetical protein